MTIGDRKIAAIGLFFVSLGVAQGDARVGATVIHSWTSGGEAVAAAVLAEAYEARGGQWIDIGIAGADNADAVAITRIIAGTPPTAKMFVAGPLIANLLDQNLLNNIDDVYVHSGAHDHTPSIISRAITSGRHVYAAPLDVHGHWIYYSIPVLRQAAISEPPATWDAFFADLERIKAAGFIPIAWGGQPWQEFNVFDSVLLTQLGISRYINAYRDKELAILRSPEFRSAAVIFSRLRPYTDVGAMGRNWNDATGMLIAGKAAIQFVGDWATPEFIHAQRVPDGDFWCAAPPGLSATTIVADTFVFPRTGIAVQDQAQRLLAATVLDPAVELRFAKAKGSIPARTDVDGTTLDTCAQKGLQLMAAGLVAPDHTMVMSPDLVGTLEDIVAEFWSDPNITVDRFVDQFVATMSAGE